MSESLIAVVSNCFKNLQLKNLYAWTHIDNVPSNSFLLRNSYISKKVIEDANFLHETITY